MTTPPFFSSTNDHKYENPLRDSEEGPTPGPCILVIFGASGDLTGRKLLPALYNLMREGQLPTNFICVGVARRGKSDDEFRMETRNHVTTFSRVKPDETDLKAFTEKLFYHTSSFEDDHGFISLATMLQELDKKYGTQGNRLYYLAVQPSYFLPIVKQLKKHQMIYDVNDAAHFSRVIMEKPFGRDLTSAIALQKDLTEQLSENQLFRIDHYLGKETVQNLLVFRFSNAIFEGLWNHRYIDNIQITVAENIGIEERGGFYESAGLLRDIIQNHLMQLLCLVTMEPPTNLSPSAIHDEKVKVLQAIQTYSPDDLEKWSVRGQYRSGFIEGKPAKGYREENNVSPTSNIETFGALRINIENWRWSGVPIYIRAGKRLAKRSTEIAVTFKRTPNILFHKHDKHNTPNCVIFRIQPDEGISIRFNAKVPGSTHIIQPVMMDFQYASYFGTEVPEAYERLICDSILGDNTLFARADESLQSWRLLTPVLDYWAASPLCEEDFYPAGTWGPTASEFLLKTDHRTWKAV